MASLPSRLADAMHEGSVFSMLVAEEERVSCPEEAMQSLTEEDARVSHAAVKRTNDLPAMELFNEGAL